MSGLPDAMATLSHPTHGGCGVDSQEGGEKMSHGDTINSGAMHAPTTTLKTTIMTTMITTEAMMRRPITDTLRTPRTSLNFVGEVD